MIDYQKLATEQARKARKSPYYWASKLSDEFTDSICETMEKNEITQAELARSSGVSRQRISNMLNGYTNYTIESMQKVSIALGYKVESLSLTRLTDENIEKPSAKNILFNPLDLRKGWGKNWESTSKFTELHQPCNDSNYNEPITSTPAA